MSAGWADLADGLPVHQDEVMAAHGCQPSMGAQSRTHGVPRPAEDRGLSDEARYGTSPA